MRRPGVYFGLHDGLENEHTQSSFFAVGKLLYFVLTLVLPSGISEGSVGVGCSTKPGVVPHPVGAWIKTFA